MRHASRALGPSAGIDPHEKREGRILDGCVLGQSVYSMPGHLKMIRTAPVVIPPTVRTNKSIIRVVYNEWTKAKVYSELVVQNRWDAGPGSYLHNTPSWQAFDRKVELPYMPTLPSTALGHV